MGGAIKILCLLSSGKAEVRFHEYANVMKGGSMNLVIHDLQAEEWEKVRGSYADGYVVSDHGTIKPCVGCFSCWNRTPGQCVLTDGYEHMGALLHAADEVHVISRYTYGGFSSFVKNVFDRSLGYVLPQFEIISGETHHKKRYAENKPFTFIFYGQGIREREKDSARQYVKAVCANIRGRVKSVLFCECGDSMAIIPRSQDISSGKVLLLNASMRSQNGNSAKLAQKLSMRIPGMTKVIALKQYLDNPADLLVDFESAPAIVLCTPLYVDGLPAQMIRFMETVRREYRGGSKRIYVLANMGLYESQQLVNLFENVRQWCDKMSFSYCGGLGVSAGELVGVLMQHLPFEFGPTKLIARGMDRLAEAIGKQDSAGELFAEPYRFPRPLYVFIANTNWNLTARKNGIKPRDLYRRL